MPRLISNLPEALVLIVLISVKGISQTQLTETIFISLKLELSQSRGSDFINSLWIQIKFNGVSVILPSQTQYPHVWSHTM